MGTLNSKVRTLESNSINGLADYLSVDTDNQGNPAIIFSGANVYVNNGLDFTNTINRLGNLFVGYNEDSTSSSYMCSDGQYIEQKACVINGGNWSTVHKSGSHNLVIGVKHNYSKHGGLVAGYNNVTKYPGRTNWNPLAIGV